MTLELRDVEAVHYRTTGIVIEVSTTRGPDELEIELLAGWPSSDGRTMRWDGKLLQVEVPDVQTAVAAVRWLISEAGLPAVSARADAVRDESERLLRGLQSMVQEHYAGGSTPPPPG